MKKKLILVSIVLSLFFFCFSTLVGLGLFSGVDLFATKFLQSLLPRLVDLPFSLFSLIGSAEMVIIIILSLKLLYNKLSIIYVFFGFVIFHVIELFGKAYIIHIGPSLEFSRYFFEFSFPSALVKPGYSYPSGHVGRTMFISTILFFLIWNDKRLSQKQRIILVVLIFIIDLIMFISRVYLGEHWLSDVIGGSLLGALAAMISLKPLIDWKGK